MGAQDAVLGNCPRHNDALLCPGLIKTPFWKYQHSTPCPILGSQGLATTAAGQQRDRDAARQTLQALQEEAQALRWGLWGWSSGGLVLGRILASPTRSLGESTRSLGTRNLGDSYMESW